MFRRLLTATLAAAALCTLGVTSAFADTPARAEAKAEGMTTQPTTHADGEKLKTDMRKLVADAREGRSGTTQPPRQQQPPPQSNSLSKGQKIAIGVGITVGVLAIIYFSVFAGKHL
jgi:hypothetical protein